MEPERKSTQREAIRQTVERVAPVVEIDQTKVLTDEELATLRKQHAELMADREMAEQHGRKGLRERLAQSVKTIEERGQTRELDRQALEKKLNDEKK